MTLSIKCENSIDSSRALSVYLLTSVATAFAASLVDGLRDDGEEDYWEKVWKSFSGIQGNEKNWFEYAKNMFLLSNVSDNANPLNWITFAKDLMSLMQGYDVNRMDAANVGKALNSLEGLFKAFTGEGKKTIGYAIYDVLL